MLCCGGTGGVLFIDCFFEEDAVTQPDVNKSRMESQMVMYVFFNDKPPFILIMKEVLFAVNL